MAAELGSIKLNPEHQLLLDQPLLKVPHELARKNLKAARIHIERERDQLQDKLKTLTSSLSHAQLQGSDGTAQAEAAVVSIDGIIAWLETLKKRLEVLRKEEAALHRQSRARITHVQELHEIPSLVDVKYDQWASLRLNRLLTDYLLRSGYGQSATALAREVGIEELVDIDAFIQCSRIEASLESRRTQECLAWCNENKQALRKINSELEFELRLQQYIELIRTGKKLEATVHARKHLTSHTESQEAIRASALLAFPPNTSIEPYKSLYSSSRWHTLSALFLKTHHDLLSLPARPALHVALSAGLSALKTPSCHSVHAASSGNVTTSTSGTSVCPICSTELNELARGVPYAHHTTSSVESDPVVLPNGRIYGEARLRRLNEKMAPAEKGKLRDPMAPSDVFDWSEVRKVYIS